MARLVEYNPAAAPADSAVMPNQPMAGSTLSPKASQASNLDYFNQLPDHVKPMVNAVIEGRIPLSGKAPLDRKTMSQLFDVTVSVDPTVDVANFAKRQQTATAFAKGKQADAVRGANQALYHMGNLYQRSEDLNNSEILPAIVNPIVNFIEEKGFGDARQAKFRQSAQAVASELRRVFAGAGGGSLQELKEWKETLPVNASESQQKAYIQNGLDLLKGGIDALNAQYQAGMGLNSDVTDLFDPKSRKVFEKLQAGENPNEPKTKQQKQADILSKPVKITNDDEYNSLKSGTRFVGPDNITRTKP
jgi:hypothetical protein